MSRYSISFSKILYSGQCARVRTHAQIPNIRFQIPLDGLAFLHRNLVVTDVFHPWYRTVTRLWAVLDLRRVYPDVGTDVCMMPFDQQPSAFFVFSGGARSWNVKVPLGWLWHALLLCLWSTVRTAGFTLVNDTVLPCCYIVIEWMLLNCIVITLLLHEVLWDCSYRRLQ